MGPPRFSLSLVPGGEAKTYVLSTHSLWPKLVSDHCASKVYVLTTRKGLKRQRPSIGSWTFFPLFAATTAGGDGETTLFRFTISDEGGASGEQRCERQRAARGACNLKGSADAAYANHVGLAGDAGRGSSHDDDAVTVGNPPAFG